MDPQKEIKRWLIAELDARPRGTRQKLARFLGMDPTAITRMTNLTGTGERRDIAWAEIQRMEAFFGSKAPSGTEPAAAPAAPAKDSRYAPVIGLASCGPEGWARIAGSRFRASVPIDLANDPDAFSVLAAGESQQPFGLYDGFLCWCSPATEPEVGDIVCVERKDGNTNGRSLTIKKLGVIGHGAYELIGFHPVEERPSAGAHATEVQEMFWESVPTDEIERISVVRHIVTRPMIG